MEKLLIIDGHNLLFQMFYGMPNKIEGKDGKSIEGIWGFTGALLKIIRLTNPSHILVIFDSEQVVNRKNIKDDYKKNRINYEKVEEEKNPFSILNDIYQVLDFLKIPHFETFDGYEADDFIASYALKYQEKFEIIISSFDHDFISLINEHITLLTYRGKSTTLYTPEKVFQKWKVKPEFFADYKALVGDTADNIAGIPRIGPKLASELIEQFGHAEQILEQKEQIKKENVRLTLDIFSQELLENLQLIRLKNINNFPIAIEQMKWTDQNFKTKQILSDLELI